MTGVAPALLVVRTLRPRQWTKNGLVLAPLLFAKAATNPPALQLALLATVSLCLVSSAGYVLNDWMDRENDRSHPEKRLRPIASGALSGAAALGIAAGALLIGLGVAAWVGSGFLKVVLAYLALQGAYSLWLKRFVIVDVMAIALGFVLRVLGGGEAIGVPVSNWLYLCTLLLAVFLGFAKRRHELSSLEQHASAHRQNLSDYSLAMLDQMMSVVAAACIVAYGLYTVAGDTVRKVGSDGLKFTLPFVIYGIFRYLYLVHRRGAGGSPERVLLSDPPLLADIGLYVAVSAYVLYA